MAIAIFVNGAKGHSALQLAISGASTRRLSCWPTSCARRCRQSNRGKMLSGHVEIDGAYFGGYVKPENRKADRVDRRLSEHRSGKRRCVVVMRERSSIARMAECVASDARGKRAVATYIC